MLAKVFEHDETAPPSTRARLARQNRPPPRPSVVFAVKRLGPRGTATVRPRLAAASSAPRRLISRILCARSKRPSLTLLAPKVLVSMTSAPAPAYASWMARTRAGSLRFKAS